ncbi:hypothetical protein [Chryseobacterium lathyri]|uniref:Uncharacterized protein n=1 Tax=Chryseobacterium lathyri TaxID=395933 RepID=A0A511YAC3_9FLAO|nr:hypothetical protein [Chryseobacterium lathyri]GEN72146.1 hypothetical protein CLA01_22180 [Chryseobacterium lathyri]
MNIENMSLIGLKIKGIVSISINKELIILFDNDTSLHFYDCIMYIDSGVVNGVLKSVKEYSGEMGFVTTLKGMNIDWDDYKFCYLNVGDEYPFSQQDKLRIAYKTVQLT